MKLIYTLLFSALLNLSYSQPPSLYLEKIRNNEAELTAFFSQMPKGGDLHHHFSGSIYAEPILEDAIAEDFYLNTTTMEVLKEKPAAGNWEKFSALDTRGELGAYKQRIMEKWSIKDYNEVSYPSDKLFFESFGKFSPAIVGHFGEGLLELKNRAIKENVSYIETEFSTIPSKINTADLFGFNSQLRQLAYNGNEKGIKSLLDTLYSVMLKRNAAADAKDFNTNFVHLWLALILFPRKTVKPP